MGSWGVSRLKEENIGNFNVRETHSFWVIGHNKGRCVKQVWVRGKLQMKPSKRSRDPDLFDKRFGRTHYPSTFRRKPTTTSLKIFRYGRKRGRSKQR